MKTIYFQRNKVTLSLGPTHLDWMLRLEYEWVPNLKSVPSNCLKIRVLCWIKNLKFKTKNGLFRYFGEQVEKDIAIFAISALKVESFMQNVRNFNLGPKLPFLDWHLKNYCHIWNQHPRICLIAKFREIAKLSKFGTKNALFGYVWARILNTIVIFEISTLIFVISESLIHTVNFGIRSTFSKGLGLGPLHKMCHQIPAISLHDEHDGLMFSYIIGTLPVYLVLRLISSTCNAKRSCDCSLFVLFFQTKYNIASNVT